MCFSQNQSGIFAIIGLANAFFVYYVTKQKDLFKVIFYFFLMEALQYFQYFWIDQCDSKINQVLTILGMLHICFQPYFSNLMFYASSMDRRVRDRMRIVLRLCFVGGVYLFLRWPMSYFPQYFEHKGLILPENIKHKYEGLQFGYDADGSLKGSKAMCGRSYEWIRGPKICTFSGRRHIAWSVPLAESSYMVPGVALHFFLMFAPFLVVQHDLLPWYGQLILGAVLCGTGPVMSAWFSDDLMEQPAIWCFFSICQILVMQFLMWIFYGFRWVMPKKPKVDEKKTN